MYTSRRGSRNERHGASPYSRLSRQCKSRPRVFRSLPKEEDSDPGREQAICGGTHPPCIRSTMSRTEPPRLERSVVTSKIAHPEIELPVRSSLGNSFLSTTSAAQNALLAGPTPGEPKQPAMATRP